MKNKCAGNYRTNACVTSDGRPSETLASVIKTTGQAYQNVKKSMKML